MTKLISPFKFGKLTSKGGPMQNDVAELYFGHRFNCYCGESHIMGPEIEVARDLPSKKQFVVECPEKSNYLNLLRIKGIFRIKGLEYKCSTVLNTEEDTSNFIRGMGAGRGII